MTGHIGTNTPKFVPPGDDRRLTLLKRGCANSGGFGARSLWEWHDVCYFTIDWRPHFGVGRKGSPRSVPISPFSSDLRSLFRERPDFFRFALFCFRFVFRTNQNKSGKPLSADTIAAILSRDEGGRENKGPGSRYSHRQMFPRTTGIPRPPPPQGGAEILGGGQTCNN